ncbi:hypothetical protein GE09DRAFT_351626 [Coniochaeta sp. 2T2.1]|nr:hypothetical protein GE09DRAFT_351626 [Coniochaeta sp. 2T2.1]
MATAECLPARWSSMTAGLRKRLPLKGLLLLNLARLNCQLPSNSRNKTKLSYNLSTEPPPFVPSFISVSSCASTKNQRPREVDAFCAPLGNRILCSLQALERWLKKPFVMRSIFCRGQSQSTHLRRVEVKLSLKGKAKNSWQARSTFRWS